MAILTVCSQSGLMPENQLVFRLPCVCKRTMLMGCQNDHVTHVSVKPGCEVRATLPASGVLRFERDRGSMAGNPAMAVDDGALVMHFADGASVYVEGV